MQTPFNRFHLTIARSVACVIFVGATLNALFLITLAPFLRRLNYHVYDVAAPFLYRTGRSLWLAVALLVVAFLCSIGLAKFRRWGFVAFYAVLALSVLASHRTPGFLPTRFAGYGPVQSLLATFGDVVIALALAGVHFRESRGAKFQGYPDLAMGSRLRRLGLSLGPSPLRGSIFWGVVVVLSATSVFGLSRTTLVSRAAEPYVGITILGVLVVYACCQWLGNTCVGNVVLRSSVVPFLCLVFGLMASGEMATDEAFGVMAMCSVGVSAVGVICVWTARLWWRKHGDDNGRGVFLRTDPIFVRTALAALAAFTGLSWLYMRAAIAGRHDAEAVLSGQWKQNMQGFGVLCVLSAAVCASIVIVSAFRARSRQTTGRHANHEDSVATEAPQVQENTGASEKSLDA